MIKVPLGKIFAARDSLADLAKVDLPPRAAFVVSDFIEEAGTKIQSAGGIYNKLLAKYGTPIEGRRGAFDLSPEQAEAMNAELDPMFAEEVELNCGTITREDFGTAPVKPAVLQAFRGWFILKNETPRLPGIPAPGA